MFTVSGVMVASSIPTFKSTFILEYWFILTSLNSQQKEIYLKISCAYENGGLNTTFSINTGTWEKE